MSVLHFVVVFISLGSACANTCKAGETFKCKDGSAPDEQQKPPCSGGPPQCCSGNTCKDAPRPGTGTGGGPQGAQPCKNPTCTSPPCAAARFGDVGCTTVSGVETISHEMKKKGETITTDAHIYGPFEAGFSEQQKSIIEGWGCTDPTLAYDTKGGLDITIAEKKVSYLCGITLPRTEGEKYIGIVGYCGGHTKDYHFHVRLNCLYKAAGGHSTAVGKSAQWKIYGNWEDFANNKLPLLDACGAHFGVTPDSAGANVYHYHVQEKPPFTIGCHGPTAGGKLVSVAACRALYSYCKNSPEDMKIGKSETVKYTRFCPCWDAKGMNTGAITELPALASSEISFTAPPTSAGTGTGTRPPAQVSGSNPGASLPWLLGLVLALMSGAASNSVSNH